MSAAGGSKYQVTIMVPKTFYIFSPHIHTAGNRAKALAKKLSTEANVPCTLKSVRKMDES